MKVLNLTVHDLTPAQIKDGGIEPHPIYKEDLKKVLTVVGIPTRESLKDKAETFARMAKSAINMFQDEDVKVLIGSGTPSFQPYVVEALKAEGVDYCYSHSDRQCIETHNTDGTVTKTFTFEHKGWY